MCSEYSQSSALNGYVESVFDALDLCSVTVEKCAVMATKGSSFELLSPPLVGTECIVCILAEKRKTRCQPGQPTAETFKGYKCAAILFLLISVGLNCIQGT